MLNIRARFHNFCLILKDKLQISGIWEFSEIILNRLTVQDWGLALCGGDWRHQPGRCIRPNAEA